MTLMRLSLEMHQERARSGTPGSRRSSQGAMAGREVRRQRRKPELPIGGVTILGVWPAHKERRAAIELDPGTFWWVVRQTGLPVTTTERAEAGRPYRHQLTLDGVDCFTDAAEPIVPPDALRPGYAVRLT
jgi:hypothetical protein